MSSPAPSSFSAPSSTSHPSTYIVRKRQYLLLYNLVSAFLWFAVLARVVTLTYALGYDRIYGGVGDFAKWTQTLAVLEIAHSALGLVRSPLPTTALQVASRLILLHFVVSPFPARTTTSPFYASMLLAWSVTEVVRYGYFVFALRGGGAVPGWLTWARYNGFFVLYPVGIGSEMVMVWRAMGGMGRDGRVVGWTVLGLYVPGSYILYTHMMKQRKKMVKGKAPQRRQ